MKLLMLILCFGFSALASETNPRLTLDSRYVPSEMQYADLRGLYQFGHEVTLLRGRGLEAVTESWMGRTSTRRSLLFLASEVVLAFYMDLSFQTALHEQAHGSRAAALGLRYRFDGGSRSFFPYYLDKLGSNGGFTFSSGRRFSPADSDRFFTPAGNQRPEARLLTSAAGMNAQTAYATFLADAAASEGAHVSNFVGHTWAKLAPSLYPERLGGQRIGDVTNVIDSYSQGGIVSIRERDIKDGNLVSFLASAGTWRHLAAVRDYISEGKVRQKPRRRALELPELENYLTTRGLSMRASSSWRASEVLRLPFAVEHVYRGSQRTELSLGADYRLPVELDLRLKTFVLMGLSPGGGVELEYREALRNVWRAGVNVDNYNSLYGERNIISLRHGQVAPSFYASLTRFF
jgi:hypothetical protein